MTKTVTSIGSGASLSGAGGVKREGGEDGLYTPENF